MGVGVHQGEQRCGGRGGLAVEGGDEHQFAGDAWFGDEPDDSAGDHSDGGGRYQRDADAVRDHLDEV